MTKASDNPFPKVILNEAATDGSDFSNPAADYRVLFLGEDGELHLKDSSGTVTDVSGAGGDVATDAIWDAAGDLVQGTGANTAAKLSAGTAGYFLKAGGAGTAVAWAARELDYVERTTNLNPTATTEATAETFITSTEITYDGSTAIMVEFWAPNAGPKANAGDSLTFWLYDGSSSLGIIGFMRSSASQIPYAPVHMCRRLTPSAAAHTYSVRVSCSASGGIVSGGAGGAGTTCPAFIRITRAV